jgi:hypothetical protein
MKQLDRHEFRVYHNVTVHPLCHLSLLSILPIIYLYHRVVDC